MTDTIIIVGVSGFIGRVISHFLVEKGYRVKGFTRSRTNAEQLKQTGVEPVLWDGHILNGWEEHLENVHAIINLSGENIGAGRWTAERKKQILSSRTKPGQLLTNAVDKTKNKPRIFIQASAVGFYGTHEDYEFEECSKKGEGFLSDVVQQCEESTSYIETMGTRRIICRFGVVLGKNGGALDKMIYPFKLFVGGKLGNGKQWFSWIHIDDLIHGIAFLLEREESRGIYNFTSPNPVTNRQFAEIAGKVLKKPSIFSTPSFILKWILGEMAEQLLLNGQKVLPARLLNEGFSFRYPSLEMAFREILDKR